MGEAERLCLASRNTVKKNHGELESVLVTYSFVISLDKSDSDGWHKDSLDFEITWETWSGANRCISIGRTKCKAIHLGKGNQECQ